MKRWLMEYYPKKCLVLKIYIYKICCVRRKRNEMKSASSVSQIPTLDLHIMYIYCPTIRLGCCSVDAPSVLFMLTMEKTSRQMGNFHG